MEKIEIIKYLNELPKEKETLKLRLESAEVIIKHVPESAFKTALESGKILSVGDARGNQYIKHELGNEDLTKIVETGSSSYLKLLSSKIESIEKKITVIIVNIKPIDLSAIFDGLSDSSRLMIAREIIILVSKRTEYKIRRCKTLNLYSNGKEETQISQLQDKCHNGAVARRIN